MANFYNRSLTNKLISLFLAVSLVPIAIVGYMSYSSGKATIQEQFMNSLSTIAESRELAIIHYLRGKEARTVDFASDGFIRDSVGKIINGETLITDSLNRHLIKNKISLDREIYGLNILDLNGRVIASTKGLEIGLDESREEYFLKTKELDYGNAYVGSVFLSNHFDVKKPFFLSSALLTDKNTGEKIGVLVNYYETSVLNEITTNREGMGDTGEIYIVNKNSYMITESRFVKDAVLKQRVDTEPVRLFQRERKVMTGIYQDYRGVPVVGASMGDEINEEFGWLGWTVLVEIDVSEAFAPARALGLRIIWITIPIIIAVVIVAYFMARGTVRPIKQISEQVVKVGDGDLTVDLTLFKRSDEVGVLSQAFNKMVDNLRGLTQQIQEGTNVIATTASELVASVAQIATGSSQTATAVSETTTTSEEVKQTALVSSEKAKHVSETAQAAAQVSQSGRKSTEEAIGGMNRIKEQMGFIAESIVKLSEQSQSIGEIITSVNDLAEQSNLLAVNASIEAAKAGEQGRGFAVVAQEIKSLAEQSKQSTTQVQNILNDIQKATSAAVMATEQGSKAVEEGLRQSAKSGESINMLSNSITEAAQAATQIVASSKQQLVGVGQVVSAMENIKQASEQNVDSTKQLETSARDLQELGQKLKDLVGRYKV